MRRITFQDMIIEIIVTLMTGILLYEVHINLVYVMLIQAAYKIYILIDSYMYMRARVQEIAKMVKELSMKDLGNGMYLSEAKKDESIQPNASDDSHKP